MQAIALLLSLQKPAKGLKKRQGRRHPGPDRSDVHCIRAWRFRIRMKHPEIYYRHSYRAFPDVCSCGSRKCHREKSPPLWRHQKGAWRVSQPGSPESVFRPKALRQMQYPVQPVTAEQKHKKSPSCTEISL